VTTSNQDITPEGPFCLECGKELRFQGHISPPGFGTSWHCRPCEKNYIQIHGMLIDPVKCREDEEPPWILRPEDVR